MHASTPGDPLVAAIYEDASHCCRDCGHHKCSCDDDPAYISPEKAREMIDSISGLNAVSRGVAPFSTFPCCGKPANVGGHATTCPEHGFECCNRGGTAGHAYNCPQVQGGVLTREMVMGMGDKLAQQALQVANSPETKAFQAKVNAEINRLMEKQRQYMAEMFQREAP
jgi:hypothetical protein